ncbi:hypothetical protein [Streptomyces mirabilis]|uniref:hypothetical protein n=1 Tax=Streptomyces mirabilis TaxID=68239 RepID=UPI0033FA9384
MSYYLAVATITPLLLLNYFLAIDAPGRVMELEKKYKKGDNPLAGGLVVVGKLGPFFVLLGAVAAGVVSLDALYYNRSTSWNAVISFVGTLLVVFAGFIHLLVVMSVGASLSNGACRYTGNGSSKGQA